MKKYLLVCVLAACGSSGPRTTEPKPAPAPAPAAFKDMNHDQRMQFMKDVVMPRAKATFAAFDPKYQTMDCVTCHGDGAKTDYKMPNPQIQALPATEEAYMAWIAKDADAARYTQFMSEKVEPMMGELLHMAVYDPKTKTGELNCMACHTAQK